MWENRLAKFNLCFFNNLIGYVDLILYLPVLIPKSNHML